MSKPKVVHVLHLTDHDNNYIHGQCSPDIEVVQSILTKLGYKRVNSIGAEVYSNGKSSEAVIRTLEVID